MTYNQLLNAVPDTFKCIALSDHYEFWCRECSHKVTYGHSKKKVRASEWQCGWQLALSDELEKHQIWHEQNPGKSFEEHRKKIADEASRKAMQEVNRMFAKFF